MDTASSVFLFKKFISRSSHKIKITGIKTFGIADQNVDVKWKASPSINIGAIKDPNLPM